MRISDWSSDVCSSDLRPAPQNARPRDQGDRRQGDQAAADEPVAVHAAIGWDSGEEGRRRLETVASRKLTRANRNIGWIEKYCRVPEGRLVGQPVKLRPWQRTILKEIYGTPTRRAIVSFGRKKDRKRTRRNSSHYCENRMPSSS